MVDATSPDGIALWTNSDPVSLVQESQTQGATIQAALNKRERYDFVWAISSERTSQTGMVQGNRGYQIDTKSEYIYDNSAWRLNTPHAEFTASKSIPTASQVGIGTLSIDSPASTSSTFVTAIADGQIRIVEPGIYGITISVDWGTAASGDTRVDISTVPPPSESGTIVRGFISSTVRFVSASVPNKRITAANTDIYFHIVQTIGANKTANSRVYVTRWS